MPAGRMKPSAAERTALSMVAVPAMRESGQVGIARVVLYRREYPVLLRPRGKGILATVLRFRPEV